MGQYDRAIATAARLIKKYGGQVTWTVVAEAALPDAAKPWEKAAGTETPHTIDSVFLTSTRLTQAFLAYLGGTETPAGKVACLIPGNVPFVPKLTDKLTRGGVIYSPDSIEPLSPSGVPIMYRIWFAK